MASFSLCGALTIPSLTCCTRPTTTSDDEDDGDKPSKSNSGSNPNSKSNPRNVKPKSTKEKHHSKNQKQVKRNTHSSPRQSSNGSTPTRRPRQRPSAHHVHTRSHDSSPDEDGDGDVGEDYKSITRVTGDEMITFMCSPTRKPRHGLLRRLLGSSTDTKWIKSTDVVQTMTSNDGYVIINDKSIVVSISGSELNGLVGCDMNSLNGVEIISDSPNSVDSASALVFLDILKNLWKSYKKHDDRAVGIKCHIQQNRSCVFACVPIPHVGGVMVHVKMTSA